MKYHETRTKVRFNEVDSYQVAWHGHYVAWLEEGRNDLAGRFGLDAAQVMAAGYLAPVVALELKFKRPVRFGDELRVLTSLHPADTASLLFVSRIVGPDGVDVATAMTTHVITDPGGVIQYRLPHIIAERLVGLMAYLEL
jgi:acyl-CoA thioester hydrolase